MPTVRRMMRPYPAIGTGAVPPGLVAGDPYFIYFDSRKFPNAIPQAIARAKAGIWNQEFTTLSSGTRAQDLRTLLVATYLNFNDMSIRPTDMMNQTEILKVPNLGKLNADELAMTGDRLKTSFLDVNRYVAAWTPIRAWDLMEKIYQKAGIGKEPFPAHGAALNGEPTKDVDTLPMVPPGVPPIVGSGWIAVAGIGIVGLVWLGSKALDIYGKHVDEDDKIIAIKQGVAMLTEQNKTHLDAEQAAGKSLPLSPQEIAAITATNKLIDTASTAYGVAAQPLPKESIFAAALNPIVKPLAQGAVDISKYLAIGAVALGGIYIFTMLRK